MSQPVLLNNVDHRDLRLITERSAHYGDAIMAALTFPAEFRDLQSHYPIIFRKGADGVSFEAVALLGFQDGENLFLGPQGWDAGYLPMIIERVPLLIGVGNGELMVHVDLEHPRVSRTDGEALFMAHGGTTEFLERMNSLLFAIHQGLQTMGPFSKALLEHNLLESFVADIELNDGSQHRFSGFYTINEERLAALDGAALASLHGAGFLQAIFMAVASLSRFRDLIERKNHAA